MKLSTRLQAPLIMGTTFLVSSLAFLALRPHHNPEVNFNTPAGATVSISSTPSETSTSPTASSQVVKKAPVAPREVTDTSTVPSDPTDSPSPSETTAPTTDAPEPSPSDSDNSTHGPIFTLPPKTPLPPTHGGPTDTPTS